MSRNLLQADLTGLLTLRPRNGTTWPSSGPPTEVARWLSLMDRQSAQVQFQPGVRAT